ncbi:MAG TPA: hypothetical protein VNB94_12600, partial [Mycobacteriales bacterium]|nr:hypothetical protein [Mycobacteriales bacterium]
MARPSAGDLARLGYVDAAAAAQLLTGTALPDEIVVAVGQTADPDQALRSLVRLLEVTPDAAGLRDALASDDGFTERLLGVLGTSAALGEHLA